MEQWAGRVGVIVIVGQGWGRDDSEGWGRVIVRVRQGDSGGGAG